MITVYNPHDGRAMDVAFGPTGTNHDTGDTVVAVVELSTSKIIGNAHPIDAIGESDIAGCTMFFRNPLGLGMWEKLFYGA